MPEADKLRLDLEDQGAPERFVLTSQGHEMILSIMERVNEISGASDLINIVQGMLDLIIEVSQAESANFFLLDPETDELVCQSVRGDVESQYLIGLRLNRQLFLSGLSLNGTQPAVIGDFPSDAYWLRTVNPVSAPRKRNVINLPINNKHGLLGVVQVFNYQHVELDLLIFLGKRLAVEIGRYTELDQALQSNQRLMTLVDVLCEIAGTLDRNRLLHLVTENASRLVNAERSSIFLVDPDTKELIFQVAYNTPYQDLPSAPPGMGDLSTNLSDLHKRVPEHPKHRTIPFQEQDGKFWYFNRSAITVPLKGEPLTPDHTSDRKYVVGGLMAHNKHCSSFNEEDAQLMQILANQVSTFLQVAELYENAEDLFLGIIKALVAAIDAKDPYTQGHSLRVSEYAVLISKELGLEETLVNNIRLGSLLHDIGKIGIPDYILLKKGNLTLEEFEVIKRHPTTGMNIMNQVKLLAQTLPAIAEHHERLDGSGYPSRLIGQQVSQIGRIVAVADVFDAMTSDRPYRPRISVPEALSFLQEKSGALFDLTCVQALDIALARSSEVHG